MLVTSVLVQLYVELVSLDERTDLLEQYNAASDVCEWPGPHHTHLYPVTQPKTKT